MIKVTSSVPVYKIDSLDIPGFPKPVLSVESVGGYYSKEILLRIDGKTYEVLAKDLIEATQNATRTAS